MSEMTIHERIQQIDNEIEARMKGIKAYLQEIKTRRFLIEQERETIKELKKKHRELMFSSFKES